VLLFDDIWDKVYAAEQQSLKEKYESDLKKEIKKLQRLRDQIKTWLGSSDVKDKAPLTEARKIIESKMEQFKICEKDTKTKAYSKEGLARAERGGDNKDSEREDKLEWVNQCLERLAELNENLEGEIEKASSGRGKTKNKDQIEKLENRMQKNRWHINKLEQVISLIEDGDLDPAKLDGIKENVDFYIESAADDDGTLDVDDEFDMYEDLQIDAILSAADGEDDDDDSSPQVTPTEEAEPVVKAPPKKATPIASINTIAAIGKAQPVKPVAAVTAIPVVGKAAPAPAKPATAASPTLAKTVPPAVNAATIPAATTATTAAPSIKIGQPSTLNSKPPADKKLTLSPTIIGQPAPSIKIGESDAKKDLGNEFLSASAKADNVTTSTSWAHAATQRPATTAIKPVEDPKTVIGSMGITPTASIPVQQPQSIASLGAGQNMPLPVGAQSSVFAAQNRPVAPPQNPTGGNLPVGGLPLAVGSRPGQLPIGNSSLMGLQSTDNQLQGGLPLSAVPPSSHTTAPIAPPQNRGLPMNPEVVAAVHMLKQSMIHAPEVFEGDKQSSYTPRNPFNTHPSFPSQPPSIIENPALFERLPMDTLFLAFYYQQGTYQQYLAAKQLKKHSWRFHKKYMTWFQRHEEPNITGDEYEEGTYVYFDYESGWCQRIKKEFKFEYAYLQNDPDSS